MGKGGSEMQYIVLAGLIFAPASPSVIIIYGSS